MRLLMIIVLCVSALGAGGRDMQAYKKELGRRLPGLTGKGVQKRLLRASKFMAKEDYAKAKAIFVRMTPKEYRTFEQAKIWQMLAYAYAQSEDYPKARAAFAKVIALDALPLRPTLQSIFSLAQLKAMEKDYNGALADLNMWFALTDKVKPSAYAFMASIMYEKKRKDKALELMLKAVALDESPKESWLVFTVSLLFEQKRYSKAAQYLYKLVRIKTGKKEYWTHLAGNLLHMNQGMHALAALRLAMMLKLLDREGEILNIVSLYLNHQLPYQASVLMRQALADKLVKPGRKNYELLANSLIQAKEFAASMVPLNKAAKLSKTGKLHALQARILLEQGKYGQAVAAFDKALGKGLKPKEEGRVLVEKGIALIELGRHGQARVAIDKAATFESTVDLARSWRKYLEAM